MSTIRVLIRLVIATCAAWTALTAASFEPVVAQAREKLAALPIRFEPNAGQWASGVLYAARAGDYGLALTNREALVSLPARNGRGRRISITLEGAERSPLVEGLDPLAARGAYLLGNRRSEWRTRVPQYTRVRYRAVYPGIDLVYYGNGRELEYDFVLAPGADPSCIRLRYRGADRISLDRNGDLLLHAGHSRLVQKRPVVYQVDDRGERREVAARYRMAGKSAARIDVAQYDRSRPLVIDPVLQYATLIGGERADSVASVKIDREGFVWVAGTITDGNIPASGDAYSGEYKGGGSDLFVAKIDPRAEGAASLVYFTYIGGKGADTVADMALDEFGNVYLTGVTASPDFPLGGFAYQTAPLGVMVDEFGITSGTIREAFVIKLQPSMGGELSLTYSSYLGGSASDEGRGIAVDAAGMIYIVGTTSSEDFPVTASASQAVKWGPADAFMAKIDPFAPEASASLAYSTYYGGNSYEDGRSIAVISEGVVCITGSTMSTELPWAGNPYQLESAGNGDVFIAKMDTTQSGEASLPYASYFGGSGLDEARKIVIDPQGKVVIAGVTLSQDLPATFGAFRDVPPGGDGDGFVIRLDLDAPRETALLYGTYLGGSGGDVINDVAVDSAGALWVTGYTLSPDFPTTSDAVSPSYPWGLNVFATRIDPQRFGDSALLYSTYLGQINIHVGYAIAVGADGTVAIGGTTAKPSILVTENAARKDYAGGLYDGFVVVLAH